MPHTRIDTLVNGLVQARRARQRWTPPAALHDLDTDEAYAVQAAVAANMGWFSPRPTVWKAGGSPTASGAPLPGLQTSPGQWSPVDSGDAQWIVEAELAFRFHDTPSAGATAADVLRCVGTVAVAIEAIDTRITGGLTSPAAWKLADQGVHGALVLGAERDALPWLTWADADWQRQAWHIDIARPAPGGVRDGTAVPGSQGQGGLPAISPWGALVWLVGHAARHTGGLRSGDVVTTGAWGVARAQRGDTVIVAFDGIGRAELSLLPLP